MLCSTVGRLVLGYLEHVNEVENHSEERSFEAVWGSGGRPRIVGTLFDRKHSYWSAIFIYPLNYVHYLCRLNCIFFLILSNIYLDVDALLWRSSLVNF